MAFSLTDDNRIQSRHSAGGEVGGSLSPTERRGRHFESATSARRKDNACDFYLCRMIPEGALVGLPCSATCHRHCVDNTVRMTRSRCVLGFMLGCPICRVGFSVRTSPRFERLRTHPGLHVDSKARRVEVVSTTAWIRPVFTAPKSRRRLGITGRQHPPFVMTERMERNALALSLYFEVRR